MSNGVVPGTGNGDTVPRTLEAGSFVLRKAAVAKYGAETLQKIRHFAAGGSVGGRSQTEIDILEARKLIELGLKGNRAQAEFYARGLGTSASPMLVKNSVATAEGYVPSDTAVLDSLAGKDELTSNEKAKLEGVKGRWRALMQSGLVSGNDYERELIQYLSRFKNAKGFALGGSSEDTVPAMLTPGEVVINKGTVSKYGLGFFNALNDLKMPRKLLGFNKGGIVPGAAMPNVAPRQFADKNVNVTLKLPNGQRGYKLG
ncbi:MAG: hypothetical protein Q8S55_23755 [Methylococcaceae bacterium]|nr:hypothetical protein [Methylococcaceae bacterium]